MTTEILFFGTAEMPRRNMNRQFDTFFEAEDLSDEPMTALFFGDASWTGTTDAAFDYALESDFFGKVVVLAPTEADDEKLIEDLASDGAEIVRHEDIYAGVMTRAEFTHAICLFDDEDEELADDVMALVEDGREVYDALGGMMKFDIAVEEGADDADPDATEDADEEPETVDAAAVTEALVDEDVNPKVAKALDTLAAALVESDEPDPKALAKQIGRATMERVMDAMEIEVYKGMHTKTMVDEALDLLHEEMQALGTADEEATEESVESAQSVDSPESEDSPEEPEVMSKEAEAAPQAADVDTVQQVNTLAARPAMAHVSFADIVNLLAVYDGDVDDALNAAAAFGITFEDAREG